MSEIIKQNAQDLATELQWFSRVLDTRLKLHFGQEADHADVFEISPPELSGSTSAYAQILNEFKLSFSERLCLILALVTYIRPHLLDVFHTKNNVTDRRFTEFGGIDPGMESGFLPTGETLAFLVTGHDLESRLQLMSILGRDHFFAKYNILLQAESQSPGQFLLKAPLLISEEYLSFLASGQHVRPGFSSNFPARFIETQLEWQDLVLPPQTLARVKEIETWLQHGPTLMQDWGMAARLRPGFRALFHGPPGTGKTVTACLLGKSSGHDVYRIDLSMPASGYITETEKNLGRLFDKAEQKNWILFFDEADALFGKRSETDNAHDRYANLEVAYLLERMESFSGLVILASNQQPDEALSKHFEAIIPFPIPGIEERLQLWQKGFSRKAKLAKEVDLPQIARRFEISGGTILEVIRYASLEALRRGTDLIELADIQKGLRRKLRIV